MQNNKKSYYLDRKILSIHSYDRDINKWPKSNEFEVILPVEYKKVLSLKAMSIQIPKNYYIFSNYNENTKININLSNTNHTITINEGSYTNPQMASELTYQLKKIDSSFNVLYNDIDKSFYFVLEKTDLSFDILASEKIDYQNCNDNNIFKYTYNWGLPSYLGFEKNTYNSSKGSEYFIINKDNATKTISNTYYVIKAPLNSSVLGSQDIYMEIDKYDSIDEIEPYSINTTTDISSVANLACTKLSNLRGSRSTYNSYVDKCSDGSIKWDRKYTSNDYSARYNSSFAKIPVTLDGATTHIHDMAFLNNVYFCHPPVEKLQKLKFKFRHHDGRLVDFKNLPVSITLEINKLIDYVVPEYDVIIQPFYGF
jgi:hypothetical protein